MRIPPPPEVEKYPGNQTIATAMGPQQRAAKLDDEKRIDSMLQLLRSMKTDIKRQKKLSAIDCRELTQKQAQKRNADADWIGMEQIKRRHELHALSVELGFAERRDNYGAIELTDGWHRFKYQPREPK